MNDALPVRRRRFRILAALAAVIVPAAAGTVWFVTRPTAQELLVQGLVAGRQNAAAGERLVRRAMERAGGPFPDAQIALCDMLARQNSWEAALKEYDAVDLTTCRIDLLVEFGQAALASGHKPAGLAALRAAAKRGQPASITALELLKSEYHAAAQQDAETAVTIELTKLDSDNPERWKGLIDMLDGQQKYPECEAALRQALDLDLPDTYRTNFEYLLIRMLIGRGEVPEARRRLTEVKRIEGQTLRVNLTEIDLLRFEGHYDAALAIARSLSPDARDLHAMYHIRGVLHLELEQYDQAARDLEKAVALRPFDENIHFRLSEAYRALRREELSSKHAKLAADITARRKRINKLKGHMAEHLHDPVIFGELAELYKELGEDAAAQHWQEVTDRLRQALPEQR